jgi:sortase (surface protein transpeptidase)
MIFRKNKKKRILIRIFIKISIKRISKIKNFDDTNLYKKSEDKKIMKNNENDRKNDCDDIKHIISDY